MSNYTRQKIVVSTDTNVKPKQKVKMCEKHDLWKLHIPSRPNPGRKEKINLKFYFHTSLRCLERFYKGLYFNINFLNAQDGKGYIYSSQVK